MDIAGDIMFREFSCSCINCITTKYEECTMDMYCGNWIHTQLKPYVSYDRYKTYDQSDCDDDASVYSNNHNR